MPALVSFIVPLLPYLAVAAIVGVVYFKIRRNATKRAVAKFEKQQQEAVAKVQEKVNVAISHDAAIDQKAKEQIDAIKKIQEGDDRPGDTFKF